MMIVSSALCRSLVVSAAIISSVAAKGVRRVKDAGHTSDPTTSPPPPVGITTTTPPAKSDEHQTVLVVISVLCGLFAWLCIVKTCCKLCNGGTSQLEHAGGSMTRERRRSAQEANRMWDEIQRTPPIDDKRERLLDHDGLSGTDHKLDGINGKRSKRKHVRSGAGSDGAGAGVGAATAGVAGASGAAAAGTAAESGDVRGARTASSSRAIPGRGPYPPPPNTSPGGTSTSPASLHVKFNPFKRLIDDGGQSYEDVVSASFSGSVLGSSTGSSASVTEMVSVAANPGLVAPEVPGAGGGARGGRGAGAHGGGDAGSAAQTADDEKTMTQLRTSGAGDSASI